MMITQIKIDFVYSVMVRYNNIKMSELIGEINSSLNTKTLTIEELQSLEKKLIEEYNNVTQEYRRLFQRIQNESRRKRQETIMNCEHNYIRYAEYHNERYFECDKCGHEKY